jgi:hypothetical protein
LVRGLDHFLDHFLDHLVILSLGDRAALLEKQRMKASKCRSHSLAEPFKTQAKLIHILTISQGEQA